MKIIFKIGLILMTSLTLLSESMAYELFSGKLTVATQSDLYDRFFGRDVYIYSAKYKGDDVNFFIQDDKHLIKKPFPYAGKTIYMKAHTNSSKYLVFRNSTTKYHKLFPSELATSNFPTAETSYVKYYPAIIVDYDRSSFYNKSCNQTTIWRHEGCGFSTICEDRHLKKFPITIWNMEFQLGRYSTEFESRYLGRTKGCNKPFPYDGHITQRLNLKGTQHYINGRPSSCTSRVLGARYWADKQQPDPHESLFKDYEAFDLKDSINCEILSQDDKALIESIRL